jgi:hypothetical protein
MADKAAGFPQIPARVWWGVRDLLNRSPKMKFDDGSLAATLDVQPAAARQYLTELKRIGLLDEKGAATELGERWRHDEGYETVVEDILGTAYPDSLVSIAPVGQAERSSVERWFAHAGLGSGTAKNKAGTYLMIAHDRPGEIKVRSAPQRAEKPASERRVSPTQKVATEKVVRQEKPHRGRDQGSSSFPLNLNVQIHISADASTDQIETIFAAMRKYLHDEPA